MNRQLGLLSSISLGAGLLAACGGGTDEPKACDRAIAGNICTIAGSGNNGYSGDGGKALEAQLSLVQDTLTAPDGTVYILDWNNHRVRKVTPDGMLHHVVGRGELGGSLDDPANTDLNHPTGMLFDETGEHLLIAAWHNSKIRKLNLASGEIVDLGGDGRRAYFGDEGPAATGSFDLPASLAWDNERNLIIMDQANQVIRRIDGAGMIHLVAGRCVVDAPAPGGPGKCAEGTAPTACPAPSGKMVCGDPMTFCGRPCTPGYGGDDGPAAEMRIAQPFGQSADPAGRMVYDPQGNLYFADTSNHIIRKIDPSGMVTRVAGTAPVDGVAQSGYSGDGGPALAAKLKNPVDLALGDDGTLYFTDVLNHCVRAVGTDGNIRTVVGTCGTPGYDGDDGPASAALLKRPYGVEWANGTLYIADTGNSVVRAVKL